MSVQRLTRVFRKGTTRLLDPDPAMTPAQVLEHYTDLYPELSNATVGEPEATATELVYTFEKPMVKTKGKDGDDITRRNDSMPWFPKEMPWWQRVQCLLGYHLRETRQTAPGHCFGFETEEGKRKGRFGLHDGKPMKLRDQCGRCHALL